MEKKRIRRKKLTKVNHKLTNKRLTSVLCRGKTQTEASKYFNVSKVAIHKRVKRLVENKTLIETKIGTMKKYKVNQSAGHSTKAPTDSGCIDLHDIRGTYRIISRGVIPRKKTRMGGGYLYSVDMGNCHVQVTKKDKVVVRFKDKYITWVKNRFEARKIKNFLAGRSDDLVNEFCKKYGWDVDLTDRVVKPESKIASNIKAQGLHTEHYKMVYPDGMIEGDLEHIAELLEGTRALRDMPLKMDALIKAVNGLVRIFTPKEPERQLKDDDVPNYIY